MEHSSRCAGFISCGSQVLEHRQAQWSQRTSLVSPRVAHGIFPDQGSSPCVLRWQADSLPLSHPTHRSGKRLPQKSHSCWNWGSPLTNLALKRGFLSLESEAQCGHPSPLPATEPPNAASPDRVSHLRALDQPRSSDSMTQCSRPGPGLQPSLCQVQRSVYAKCLFTGAKQRSQCRQTKSVGNTWFQQVTGAANNRREKATQNLCKEKLPRGSQTAHP